MVKLRVKSRGQKKGGFIVCVASFCGVIFFCRFCFFVHFGSKILDYKKD
ncbi:hypothetical protein [Helicobacter sp. T3_23-1056]